MRLTEPDQLKALGHVMRTRIVTLLLDRTASVSQLADALEAPVGTVGHHLGVLEDAGLVEVVTTRQVRGIVEKRYGRTARLFLLDHPAPEGAEFALGVLDEARAEAVVDLERDLVPAAAIAYTRLPPERVAAFGERLKELIDEFRLEPAEGDTTWALVVGLLPTARRPLPDEAPTVTDRDDDDTIDADRDGSHIDDGDDDTDTA